MSTATIATTRDLVRAAQDGDRAAIEQLITRYTRLVWSVVRSFRLGEADTDDAVQTIWLRMIEHLHELRDDKCLPAWLATIARRECLKAIRQGRREVAGLDTAVLNHADEHSPGPEQRTIDGVMNDLLWEQVASLPPAGRDLLVTLTAADAPPYADYARRTGVPIGSIGPTRMRYMRKLRQRLESTNLGADIWR
jgi:RNA polymerase sigma factor (sigma-70 family)